MKKLPSRGSAPAGLKKNMAAALKDLRTQVASGKVKLSFRKHVYSRKDVRSRLDRLQSGTCAYCEARLRPISNGHIDHYRPKGGYTDEATGKLIQPGYYLLAYSWSNLLLACPRCNDEHKKNRFPLVSEGGRNIHNNKIKSEDALLVDPFKMDPREYVRFRGNLPYAYNGSHIGNTTIDVISLDGQDLNDAREHIIRILDVARKAMTVHDVTSDAYKKAEELFNTIIDKKGQFSSCILDYRNNGYKSY